MVDGLDGERQPSVVLVVVGVYERAAASFDIQGSLEQAKRQQAREANPHFPPDTLDGGRVLTELAVTRQLRSETLLVQRAIGDRDGLGVTARSGHGVTGLRARMIAAEACSWTW